MVKNNLSEKIIFNYYHSAADLAAYAEYEQGLTQALQRFNVDKVILSTIEKVKKQDSFFILAKHDKQTIGGIRLEIKTKINKLPIENCEIQFQSAIKIKINKLVQQNKTVAELSGLWVSSDAKGYNIGARLINEATELAFDLGVQSIIGMPPLHTLPYFKKIGYVADPEIPPMAYPDDRYISTVTWLHRDNTPSLQIVSSQSTLATEVDIL